jgi:hypothetical protein
LISAIKEFTMQQRRFLQGKKPAPLHRGSSARRIAVRALLLWCCVHASARAEVELAGEQDGFYDANAYLVTTTVTVKAGRTLTFAPGTIVRFRRYSGIIVEGTIVCRGTAAAPIIFTSANDRVTSQSGQKQPLPFDWNGIEVRPSSPQAEFVYTRVLYSSYGIQVVSPSTQLTVTNALFRDNGNAPLSIGDSIVNAADDTPFSYVNTRPAARVDSAALAEKIIARKALSFDVQPQPHTWRLPVRIGIGTVIAAGSVLWITASGRMDYNADKASHSPNPDPYREKWYTSQAVRNTGIALCMAGVSGFAITFIF